MVIPFLEFGLTKGIGLVVNPAVDQPAFAPVGKQDITLNQEKFQAAWFGLMNSPLSAIAKV
jgi:hypothetical protein